MVSTLFAAAILGNVNAVKGQLLRAGDAELLWKAGNGKGETVLHVAAKLGHSELVQYLARQHPMAAHAIDPVHGRTPLHLAALYGQADAVMELLRIPGIQQQQLIAAVDRHGHTALHLAVRHAHVDIVRSLLRNSETQQVMDGQYLACKDRLGWTVLHSAAGVGRADIIEEIFDKWRGSAILEQVLSTSKWSPLHVASWLGHVDAVQLMCERMSIPVDTTGNSQLEGLTPLHMAAHNGHDAVVDYLLSHKDLQSAGHRDALQRTALHYAARQGHASAVSKLLRSSKFKASGGSLLVDATDVNGLTALHLAAREGHEQVVSILLEGQANANAKTQSSLILESLLDSILNSNTPHEIMQVDPMVLEADCWCINQMTPLHLAARNGHMAVVRRLLRHRPEVDVRVLDGHGLLAQDWAEVREMGKEFLVCLEEASRQAAAETSARVPEKKLQILREELMKWQKTKVLIPPSTFCSFQSMQYTISACDNFNKAVDDGCMQNGKLYKEDTRGLNLHSSSDYDEFLVRCRPSDEVDARNITVRCTPLALAFENNNVEICKLILNNTKKVEDDLHKMLKTAISNNWLEMAELLVADTRTRTGGDSSEDLLDVAKESSEQRFLDLLLRRTTIKERLLQERKEHLDSIGRVLVIAVLITSITYQGDLQPPQGKHQGAQLLFERLNSIAFYTSVAATIAVALGARPIRHLPELVNTRNLVRISRGISCVLLLLSSACVVWAYAAAGFTRASDSAFVNAAGAIATTILLTLFFFWFAKHYIQLFKCPCRSLHGSRGQNKEGYMGILFRTVAQIVQKSPGMFSGQENHTLPDNQVRRTARGSIDPV